ncbi:helix-turn-helix domain protein [Sulfolobus islandicus L.S.2.15]|uniref:Helix-turn-helix domain protein n=1 Tax=Saccharolobus islandicus (strain L.S.2.15 / Lassen \|nr:tyrosine-type recombinase/integrase [Sulfolobus islandicus]ACP35971.1 helix-turn-helix domain protein [Sulfolobus islandicus L.S.2.15]
MSKINVEKLDDQKKLSILRKAVEKHGLSYVSRFIGVDRSTLNRYLNGKIQRIPQEIVEKASELLTVDELSDVVYGLRSTDVDPTTAISVIIKAKKDEGFRNFFLSLLWQELGDYIKEPSNSYLVTKDDIELFEKIVRNEKSRKTAEERINYLRRALADLDYELTPTKLKEYILDLSEESKGRAEHTAKALKLFIKEVVKPKSPRIARELHDSFKIPKTKPSHKPYIPEITTVKQIFNNIKDIGAKAFFLLLAETGLRVGEVLSLKLEQVDFEHRIIHVNKISETKRAYITFLHESTVKWLKEVYLSYREEFIKKYESSLRKLAEANPTQGINIEEWKAKLFPFREDSLRVEIKEAMRKVLGKEFRLYDMRAFFTSYMIKQKVPGTIVNLLQGRAPPQEFRIMEENYFVISEIELREWYDKYAPRLL